MHKLLERQMKRHLGARASDPELAAFLRSIDEAYQQHDADRQLLERSLELTSEDLNKRYEQLLAAKEAAEAANRAKTAFLANMSHEIRTPMNGVLGMLALALEEALGEELRDYLETARSSGEHLLGILNAVLDLSKIEADRMVLEDRPIDPRALFSEVVKSFGGEAQKRKVDLVCVLDPSLPKSIGGDPLRLRQVALNLVGNALKFTTAGEVIVSVAFEVANEAEGWLSFEVKDSGIGIAKDKVEHIFEAFAQADSSMTRRFGGSGLGLAICSRLTELMGGAIHVESEPGRGSSFRARVRARALVPADTIMPKKGSLLILEDNRHVAEVLAASLELAGYDVEIATELSQAERRADLVLADADLMPPRIDRPTVLMASPFDGRDRLAPTIAKPVITADLLRAVETHLSGTRIAPGAGPAREGAPVLPFTGLSILLAEDNPVNQKLMVRLLERRGIDVVVANDGREALEAFSRAHFDAILMDVSMPDVDGLAATRTIRSREKEGMRRIPIIALTAHTMPGDAEECSSAGMDAHLAKPIDTAVLFEKLHALCFGKC